jgi:hypothetical protein
MAKCVEDHEVVRRKETCYGKRTKGQIIRDLVSGYFMTLYQLQTSCPSSRREDDCDW